MKNQEFNRVMKQCIKCRHFSAGGQNPCDPFCMRNKDININKPCPIFIKENAERK